MPRIFDNIEEKLLSALEQSLPLAHRSDFCVGYFNLRGWKKISSFIDNFKGGENNCCRLLVGMQRLPEEELKLALYEEDKSLNLDRPTAIKLKKKLAEDFRTQLTYGFPTNDDEVGLRKLSVQLKSEKLHVKLYLSHQLHAKLYLAFRNDPINPIIGYLGSSNLTFSGLSEQGELNVDVLDNDAAKKLSNWFNDRWNDQWCIDISKELIEIIEESWAREKPVPPYHIYIKIAYHLAQEARAGLSEFRIPKEFGNKLFDYQAAAVKIAAHHINKRNGVIIGDVVGLGKTLMATAVAKVMQEDRFSDTLIICPKNLVQMWEDYVANYRLIAKVISITKVNDNFHNEMIRYSLVLIDESHNLRNRFGKRYNAIKDYISKNNCKCMLLSATPYNKTFLDLSSQLALFLSDDEDIGIRPEKLIKEIGETEFIKRHQCPLRSLAAFEKSDFAEDWRELMRLYLVRRTRSFIQNNYAEIDSETGRKHLTFEDGTKSFFPIRVPKTVTFPSKNNQYSILFSDTVVKTINELKLPRYGLGNYVAPTHEKEPSQNDSKLLSDLSRAGKRLMGFCRTNLFKRLESSGFAFIQSIERHILRNYVFLYAIENNLSLPVGTQNADFLDPEINDSEEKENIIKLKTVDDFKNQAKPIYDKYLKHQKNYFKWIKSEYFIENLKKDLIYDAEKLIKVLEICGGWKECEDPKLEELKKLINKTHKNDKVLIFTQFADTVEYIEKALKNKDDSDILGVTGDSDDPTMCAWRFSPVSNKKENVIKKDQEVRILISTDVLSEGQNLQDANIIVNFDLPWAIIRLIQRAGRIDRIGQRSDKIICYSFLPADGVENIIHLRRRVRERLNQNAEVVGTDEAFFEDENTKRKIVDLYHEKAGVLDDDENEVDLTSYAYEIWKKAIDSDPDLKKIIPEIPNVVYSTKQSDKNEGVIVYVKTQEGTDALALIDKNGESITESQYEILKVAQCEPLTQAVEKFENHHELVKKGVKIIAEEERSIGGQLGRSTGTRFKIYEKLKNYAQKYKDTVLDIPSLHKVVDEIYNNPLKQSAIEIINRQIKASISDQNLVDLVISLREEDKLCAIQGEKERKETQIICSMGIRE